MKTLQELFRKGNILLRAFPDNQLESRLLLCKSASITEEEFYSHENRLLTREQERSFFRMIAQRLSGIPLAYLTGCKEFWSIPFEVYPGVLIPRPETELIVEKTVALSAKKEETIVDIGTGCGNIAIALARELPAARIIATDVSQKAIRTAKLNAADKNMPHLTFIQGSLFSPLEKLNLKNKCDFIVSNPPYVSGNEWKTLAPEIKKHEPRRALVAGETGLEVILKLVKDAPKYLKPGGYLVFEIGWGQKERVMEMFGRKWTRLISTNDLSGVPRVIVARKRLR